MNENRKEIIVKEIHYWKESKLLPEQYCNFLLALYTEGRQSEKKAGKRNSFWLAYAPLLLVPVGIFIYFTELSFFLQMALYAFVLIIGTGISFYFIRKTTHFMIPMISTALLFLLFSVDIVSTIFPYSRVSLYSIIILNCLAWFIIGKKVRLLYFTISALLGMILLFVSMFI